MPMDASCVLHTKLHPFPQRCYEVRDLLKNKTFQNVEYTKGLASILIWVMAKLASPRCKAHKLSQGATYGERFFGSADFFTSRS